MHVLRVQEADNDGSGELDIDEFVEHLGPFLGTHLTKVRSACSMPSLFLDGMLVSTGAERRYPSQQIGLPSCQLSKDWDCVGLANAVVA